MGRADEGKSVAGVDVIAEGTCIVILEGCRDLDDEGTGGGNESDGEMVGTSGPICDPIVGNAVISPGAAVSLIGRVGALSTCDGASVNVVAGDTEGCAVVGTALAGAKGDKGGQVDIIVTGAVVVGNGVAGNVGVEVGTC